jgi:hypothetical protein
MNTFQVLSNCHNIPVLQLLHDVSIGSESCVSDAYKNRVLTSQKTQYAPIIKVDRLMLLGK